MDTFKGVQYQREALGMPWVRPSLFLEMFAQDPSEWICIDTVDAAGRWDMQVFGYQPPKQPTRQQMVNICRNAYGWRADAFATGTDDLEPREDTTKVVFPPKTKRIGGRVPWAEATRMTLDLQATSSPLMCVIERVGKGDFLDSANSLEGYFTDDQGQERYSDVLTLQPFAFEPAATLLRDLPGVRPAAAGAPAKKPMGGYRTYQKSLMSGCIMKRTPADTAEACAAACGATSGCRAYSFSPPRRACELKHTLTALRLDPEWLSGAPLDAQQPEHSARAVVMDNHDFTVAGLEGDLIETSVIDEERRCTERCETEAACYAVDYHYEDKTCRRFRSITAFLLRVAGGPAGRTIHIKRQK